MEKLYYTKRAIPIELKIAAPYSVRIILPIHDSWSNVMLNFEHGSSNWGVIMAGYPLFIP